MMVLEHETEGRPQQLVDAFNALWREGHLCDVILQSVDGNCIRAHRLVLAASSIYFKLMFTVNMEEKLQEVITIKDVTSKALRLLVRS